MTTNALIEQRARQARQRTDQIPGPGFIDFINVQGTPYFFDLLYRQSKIIRRCS